MSLSPRIVCHPAARPFSSNTSGDVPSLTDFEGGGCGEDGGGLMEGNPESGGGDSPETTRESSCDEASSSSTLRNSYQVQSVPLFHKITLLLINLLNSSEEKNFKIMIDHY